MSTETKRRNSLERYQPKRNQSQSDGGDFMNQFNNMSLESSSNSEMSRQNSHGGKPRRGVNTHLYSNSGRGNQWRGRGRGRGRGQSSHVNDGSNRHHQQQHSTNIGEMKQENLSWGTPNSNGVENVTFQATDENSRFKQRANKQRNDVHQLDRNYHNKPHKKNTETFKPSHKPTDMRILCAPEGWTQYSREILSRDVLIVNGLFCPPSDLTIYNKLLNEIKTSGIDQEDLWKLWHGDSHVIADDKLKWKDACPTFHMVLSKIEEYFQMDIKATRLNWYRDSKEWKPFHHDAAAIKPDKAKTQNLTVAVSFGAERDAAFEHATTKTAISMPQPNGTIYVFAKDVNIIWRHGILQVPPEKYHDEGRISIIAWGWSEQTPV